MTMTESVARAITLELAKLPNAEFIFWDDLDDAAKRGGLALARAAIEAMREHIAHRSFVAPQTSPGDVR
jgi:hypothetical protein